VRTYWLSFTGPHKPQGEQFLGVVVVDVQESEAQAALKMRPAMYDKIHGPWVGAALRSAHISGCNPGGEVSSWRVDDAPPERLKRYPRLRLLSRVELGQIEVELEQIENPTTKGQADDIQVQ